jgi:AraC family transcriptional regulator of arabinose operon
MDIPDPNHDPQVATMIADHWRQKPGYWTARHQGATSWLLILTLEGSGKFINRAGSFETSPGDAVLMRPKRLHEYGIAPGQEFWDFLWVHFHLRTHWVGMMQWTTVGPGMMLEKLHGDDLREIALALEEAIAAKASSAKFRDTLALNHLERALIWIAAKSPASSGPKMDSRVRTAIERMQKDLSVEMSIAEIAESAGLSESRMAHLFSQEVGVPPRRYLENLRLDRAKQLLEMTDMTVREIAHAMGFASEFYFSQRFQSWTGMRPTAYRIKMRP